MLQQLQGMHKLAAAQQQPATAAVALLESLLGQGSLQGNRSPKSVPSTAAALVEGLKPLLGQLQVGILRNTCHAEHACGNCGIGISLESEHSPQVVMGYISCTSWPSLHAVQHMGRLHLCYLL